MARDADSPGLLRGKLGGKLGKLGGKFGSGKKSRGNTRVSPGMGHEGFWNRPLLMNLTADFLMLAGGLLLVWSTVLLLQRLPVFPMRMVVVTTPVQQVSRAQIEHTARNALKGNFFTLNLDAAQAAFETMPWVRRADVRRRWPDGVELAIEEHVPVALWTPMGGESRLVNTLGEVFNAPLRESLPAFAGPEGSAANVLERYRTFSTRLASIGRQPTVVRLSARQAWQLKLDDGVVIELGRDQVKHPLSERLQRFIAHYEETRNRMHSVDVVDMRYPNGFALRASKS